MSRLIAVVFVSSLGASAAAVPRQTSQPAREPGLSTKSFGEGGGYKHPDAAVGGFLESVPTAQPQAPDRAIRRAGSGIPSPRTRPAAFTRRRPLAPLVPESMDPETSDAAASEDARRDYEERLLGAAAETSRPGRVIGPGNGGPDASHSDSTRRWDSGVSGAGGEGSLFVTLELDPREAGSLRDAVAGLGAAAAFRPDARFEPLPGSGGSVRVSGWLPVSRLGSAVAHPGVKRVDVERGLRGRAAAGDGGVAGDFLVGLRVADAAHPEESVAAGVVDLAKTAGFIAGDAYKVRRAFGVETAPGGGAVAMVAGSLPLARLSRAMGRPGVVTVRAALPPSDSEARTIETGGFARFVMTRGLWLALFTLLLLLPAFGTALKNGLAVFVPYR